MLQTEMSISRSRAWQETLRTYPPQGGVTRRLIIVLALASCFAVAVDWPRVNQSGARQYFSCNPFLTNDPCAPMDSGSREARAARD